MVNELKKKHGQGTYTIQPPPTEEEEEDAEDSAPKILPHVYSGAWINGERSGVGKMASPNGDRYFGQFSHNVQHGEGTYKFANGDVYSGQWVQGVKSGQGCYEYAANKSQLVGTWVGGSIARGQWIYADGSSWQGDFKNGRPIGQCTYYNKAAGNQQNGEWVEILQDEADEEGVTELKWRGAPCQKANVPPAALNRAAYRPDIPEVKWEAKVEAPAEEEEQ